MVPVAAQEKLEPMTLDVTCTYIHIHVCVRICVCYYDVGIHVRMSHALCLRCMRMLDMQLREH